MSRTIGRSHLDSIGPDTPTTDLAKSLRFVAKWTLNPPHPVPLQEAARRLEGLGELEAIVRDLAALGPQQFASLATLRDRAREWVSAHPVSGDPA